MNVADRCIEWMEDVIEVHMDMCDGNPDGDHRDAIEDAKYIIECIKKCVR